MSERYITILAMDEWMIFAWDAEQQRVREYITELWSDWWRYSLVGDDVSVMAHFLDQYTPRPLDEDDSNKFLARIDARFPGITAGVHALDSEPDRRVDGEPFRGIPRWSFQ